MKGVQQPPEKSPQSKNVSKISQKPEEVPPEPTQPQEINITAEPKKFPKEKGDSRDALLVDDGSANLEPPIPSNFPERRKFLVMWARFNKFWKILKSIFWEPKWSFSLENTYNHNGVQSKNNEYHIVNKVENQGIYEWILNLIDNVVFVVFALYDTLNTLWV